MCMMSEGQISTHCPQPSHLVMYTKVGIRLPPYMADLRGSRQVRWTIRLLDPLLEGRRGLVEHMGELGPGNGNEEQRREEDVEAEGYLGRRKVMRRLHDFPYEGEGDARQQADDEQIRTHQTKRRMPLFGYVYPEEEEKPVTADEDHQSADVPQHRPDRGRRRGGRRKTEDHYNGRDEIRQKSIEHQEMRDPPHRVAEFAGGNDLFQQGPDRQGSVIYDTEPPRGGRPGFLSLLQEEFGAALVQHVDQRSDGDRGYHQDDIGLHAKQRQKCRKF